MKTLEAQEGSRLEGAGAKPGFWRVRGLQTSRRPAILTLGLEAPLTPDQLMKMLAALDGDAGITLNVDLSRSAPARVSSSADSLADLLRDLADWGAARARSAPSTMGPSAPENG